ncbi:hypothetical protein Cni_G06148 [Canna indica]|uniref:Uncharacterized protein n=1 Tax=Canna indica TaxID=4628 RepID=A0AAQ3Q3S9_9LILI|nr:hypothetical protein Cni_G06148 [Canna indica]
MTSRSNLDIEETSVSSIVASPMCHHLIEAGMLTLETKKILGEDLGDASTRRTKMIVVFLWHDAEYSERGDLIRNSTNKKINLLLEKNTILVDKLTILKEQVNKLEDEKKNLEQQHEVFKMTSRRMNMYLCVMICAWMVQAFMSWT